MLSDSEKVLANLLAPTKPDFCGQKFEVKINDIIFTGFPTVLNIMKDDGQSHGPQQTDFIFNVVFALRVLKRFIFNSVKAFWSS